MCEIEVFVVILNLLHFYFYPKNSYSEIFSFFDIFNEIFKYLIFNEILYRWSFKVILFLVHDKAVFGKNHS